MKKFLTHWPYTLLTLAFFFKSAGGAWDVAYHFKHFREFYQLPHLLNGFGDLLTLAMLAYLWKKSTEQGQKNLRVIIYGIIVFILAIGMDQWWHEKFGIDLTTWSLSHFALYLGTFIAIVGAFRYIYQDIKDGFISSLAGKLYTLVFGYLILDSFWFPLLQQEEGAVASYNMAHGIIIADADLMALFFKSNFSVYGSVPMWVYGAWAGLSSVLIFHFVKIINRKLKVSPYIATLTAVVYIGFRAVANLIFVGVTYPTSVVPYYLIIAAILFDVVYNMLSEQTWVRDVLSSATVLLVLAGFSQIQTDFPIHPPMPFNTTFLLVIPAMFLGYIGARWLARWF